MDRDAIISNILKSDLLLSDYTLTTDPNEKEIFLELLHKYLELLNNSTLNLLYFKICDSSKEEKDIYIEILIDTLSDLKVRYCD